MAKRSDSRLVSVPVVRFVFDISELSDRLFAIDTPTPEKAGTMDPILRDSAPMIVLAVLQIAFAVIYGRVLLKRSRGEGVEE